MTTRTHILGFPRMGAHRELKFALEKHWRGEIDRAALEEVGGQLRARHWQAQRDAGLDYVTVGDFACYDHVANHVQLFGCEPARFGFKGDEPELSRYFKMARGVEDEAGHAHDAGCKHGAEGAFALEMTKWFDTNYHYLVPEFTAATQFRLASTRLFDEVAEAQQAGHAVKAVLLGPLSFLYLGKEKEAGFDRLSLLDALLPVYEQVLNRLKQQGVEWVQIDEPILGLDLPDAWRNAFERAYWQLARSAPKLLLATYFSPLLDNLRLACQLPVAGLHVDAVRAPQELTGVADWLATHKVLSIGIVDGRNIWRTDLDAALATLRPVVDKRRGELWIAPSCSLLHVPFSLAAEKKLDAELRSWLAFAVEKLGELRVLRAVLDGSEDSVAEELEATRAAVAARRSSPRVHRADVALRLARSVAGDDQRASSFGQRQQLQRARFALPALPTTTIGSFPQTQEIRAARAAFKRGELDAAGYREKMRAEIALAVRKQEELGIDV
ncbi:MAG: 5-methyltetrahydropteroyltriglutamate--homocysteine S-methyltransferase, partial [Variovorax paradoxus]